jgi:predicted extracellular nuclease
MAKKAFVVKTDGSVNEVWADWDYTQIKEEVGGLIEAVHFGDNFYFCYANEEGKLIGLPENQIATDLWYQSGQVIMLGDYIAGDVVFFGGIDEDGDTVSADRSLWEKLEEIVKTRMRLNSGQI